jgi:anti-anti-sigma factor
MGTLAVKFSAVDGRLAMSGECDFANASAIEAWLDKFGVRPVEVDLSGVTFFDASMIRVFLAAATKNPYLRIVNPSPIVKRVLELTDTYKALTNL